MEDFENMSNNQILMRMKEMEHEHEAIKSRILKIVEDELEPLEKAYEKAGKVLNNRLKPNNDELPKGDMYIKKD